MLLLGATKENLTYNTICTTVPLLYCCIALLMPLLDPWLCTCVFYNHHTHTAADHQKSVMFLNYHSEMVL